MFVAVAVFLVLAWVLGYGVFHAAGALIHLLLLLAIISVLWHFVRGRGTAA
jgi:hypothetical protein